MLHLRAHLRVERRRIHFVEVDVDDVRPRVRSDSLQRGLEVAFSGDLHSVHRRGAAESGSKFVVIPHLDVVVRRELVGLDQPFGGVALIVENNDGYGLLVADQGRDLIGGHVERAITLDVEYAPVGIVVGEGESNAGAEALAEAAPVPVADMERALGMTHPRPRDEGAGVVGDDVTLAQEVCEPLKEAIRGYFRVGVGNVLGRRRENEGIRVV